MKVLDPGHRYELDPLDGEQANVLVFVKREGVKYPGNVGHHPGTTTQEVLRALIERCYYINGQQFSKETERVETLLRECVVLLEKRAARLHGRSLTASLDDVVWGRGKCVACGHVGCAGECRAPHSLPESSEDFHC
jgi:hypothetical protein